MRADLRPRSFGPLPETSFALDAYRLQRQRADWAMAWGMTTEPHASERAPSLLHWPCHILFDLPQLYRAAATRQRKAERREVAHQHHFRVNRDSGVPQQHTACHRLAARSINPRLRRHYSNLHTAPSFQEDIKIPFCRCESKFRRGQCSRMIRGLRKSPKSTKELDTKVRSNRLRERGSYRWRGGDATPIQTA